MDDNRPYIGTNQACHLDKNHAMIASVPSISLVLPAPEEARTIVRVIREANAALSQLTQDYEILVVIDGSLCEDVARVQTWVEETDKVRFIRQPGHVDYGTALRLGLTESTKQVVCVADANGQFDLHQLDRLVLLGGDHDVVCGYRIQRSGNVWQRFCFAAYNLLARGLLGVEVRDCNCGLKLFRRETVDAFSLSSDGPLVHAELLTQARQLGKSIVEVGVTHRARAAGKRQASLAQAALLLVALVRYWWSSVAFPNSFAHGDGHALDGSWAVARRSAMTLLLVGLCLAVFFPNLDYSLIEPDETRYAQIALDMQESGDWVVPKLFGEPYLDKPPLLYWMTAASYWLFGANDSATRLPSALCATLSVLATYLLGRRLIGDRAAWFGALAVLLSAGFVLCARFLIMDGPLTLFTTLTLLIAANALYRRRGALLWWVAAGVTCGVGMLVKGPISAVICIPPVLVAGWLGSVRYSRWRMLLALLVPCVLITAPWFFLVLTRQQEFAGHFFWKHHVLRFWNAFDHQAPWWYYVPVLALGMFPASLLLPALVSYLLRHDPRPRNRRTAELGYLVASGSWILVFFSLSSCKLPAYILPAVPMLCLAIGKMVDDTVWSVDSVPAFCRYVTGAAQLAKLLLPTAAIVLGICDLVLGAHGALVAATAFGLVAAAIVLVVAVWRYQAWGTHTPWFGVTALCLVVGIYGFAWVFPEFATWRSRARAAATLREGLANDAPVVFFGGEHFATRLELEKEAAIQLHREQLDDFSTLMAEHSPVVVVTRPFHAERIREVCGPLITLRPASVGRDVYVAERNKNAAVRVGGLDDSVWR